MCGICGYLGDDRMELIDNMSAAMSHRGPDHAGTWHDRASQVGLGHRRLSILDLSSAGNQPIINEDGRIVLTFNGEIYNFAELREALISQGHQFRSNTDSEVLVHLYEEKGEQMLDDLNGMFAFAIWDSRRKQLFIARDHAGIKPLYYWQAGERFYFASELKALLQIPGISRELNRELLGQYLTFLWIPGQSTMLKEINKLEPGYCMTIKEGRISMRRWFSLAYEPDESVAEGDWPERVHEELMLATRRQMVSDVPLGAFLSGGVDSSSLVACMRKNFPNRPINCYTARFNAGEMNHEGFEDDAPYARHAAKHLDVNLREFVLKPDVTQLLSKMVWHLDEPDADPAVFPAYLIARAAHEDGTTVLLSGVGGDEMFFGYRSHEAYARYATMPRALQLVAAMVGASGPVLGAQNKLVRRAAKFGRGMDRVGVARHLALVDWSSPATRSRLLVDDSGQSAEDCIAECFSSFNGAGELNRHSHVLIQTFLACHNLLYTDKSSMAASVEVRVPFLDVELMRLCATIPERYQIKGGSTKRVLRQAMRDDLPQSVLRRGKTGFMAPLRKWIKHDLNEMIGDSLSESRLRDRGLFNAQVVREIIDENRANKADHAYLIYALLTLECWMQTFIDR